MYSYCFYMAIKQHLRILYLHALCVVIDHSTGTSIDPSTSINTNISDMSACPRPAIDVETTITTVAIATTITHTPSPSTAAVTITSTVTHTPAPSASQCFSQQTDDSECNCNFVLIPVLVVAVIIILILCIVIFVVTWKLKHRKVYDDSKNLQMNYIDNGLVSIATCDVQLCVW